MPNKNQARGRPLSAEVAEATYGAALELVAERGLGGTSRREIAVRAGVSRQTLYNRWESVGDIVLEALLVRGEREIGGRDPADSRVPRERLRDYVADLAAALDGWAGPGVRAVAALAQQDGAFAERFRTRFLEPRHRRLLDVVAAACADTGQDPALVAELIAGSMWYRLVVSGEPLDARWVDAMTALVPADSAD
ncbi:MAG: TetR/AcrR family transcriptional regulator [Gammaproteobacteria bacterium]